MGNRRLVALSPHFARVIPSRRPRRGALAFLAGVVAIASACANGTSFGPGLDATVAPQCTGTTTACSEACVDTRTDFDNCGTCGRQCLPGQVCSSGSCALTCSGGTSKCGAACVDEQVDPRNCGTCGKACAADDQCSAGQCASACAAGYDSCTGNAGAYCANPQTDNANCGACGNQCAAGTSCAGGACVPTCQTGLTLCLSRVVSHDAGTVDAASGSKDAAVTDSHATDAGSTAPSLCADLEEDQDNCGACGNACPAGHACAAGKCFVSCLPSEINCGGKCIDPTTDNRHCGASGACLVGDGGTAGVACAAGTTCNGSGICAPSCLKGETFCGQVAADGGSSSSVGTCVDLLTSNQYCSSTASCGKGCPAGEACVAGVCTVSCPGTEIDCGGACIDPTTNNQHCGAVAPCSGANAGSTCMMGQVCSGSACAATCQGGLTVCNGSCTNTLTDSKNCNACGKTCAAGQLCNAGACTVLSTPAPCTSGTDPESGSAWVVCSSSATALWVSSTASGGSFHATQICNDLGYTTVTAHGGNFSDVCGYNQAGTSCKSPGAETFDNNGAEGTDANGVIFGSTVMWSCAR